MDRWGDHALVCSCNGDRTLRHNAVRDAIFCEAIDAGVDAEREKAGLLPPKPDEEAARNLRRPADVYLPVGMVVSLPRWTWQSLRLTAKPSSGKQPALAGWQPSPTKEPKDLI